MLNKKKQELYEILLWYLRNLKKIEEDLKKCLQEKWKKEKKREEKNVCFARESYRKITHLCWEEKSKREFNSFEVEKNSLFF